MRSNLETIVGRVRRTDPSIWTKFCFFNLQFKTSGIYTAVRLHWLMMVYKSFKNVVKTSMTPLATPLMSQFFLFLQHFDIVCDLLLNRCTTWNWLNSSIPTLIVLNYKLRYLFIYILVHGMRWCRWECVVRVHRFKAWRSCWSHFFWLCLLNK